MSLSINTNVMSLNAQRNLSLTQGKLATSLERLSSGLRINKAADDAAGLSISENMRASIRSMNQATRNANDGISLVQTAEGALNETSNILVRMRELAVQGANGTLNANDKAAIDAEYTQMTSEIDRIANNTSFNGKALLSANSTITLQVGTGTTAGVDSIDVALKKADATSLGITNLTSATAATAIGDIDTAIKNLNTQRGSLGAYQNRLTSTINNLQVGVENTSAAESRIRDVDVASETANMTKANILSQAGVAILAQANQAPNAALTLLRG